MNENKQNFFQQNAGALILVVLAGAGFWAYSTFKHIETTAVPSAVGQEVIRTLKRLEQVSLDSSIFASSEFQQLKAFELVIPSFTPGRVNPFLPFR